MLSAPEERRAPEERQLKTAQFSRIPTVAAHSARGAWDRHGGMARMAQPFQRFVYNCTDMLNMFNIAISDRVRALVFQGSALHGMRRRRRDGSTVHAM